jgi:hypothetical protein
VERKLTMQYKNIMKIAHKKWLIASSKSYVINFIFKPQLNKINFNETFVDMIYNNFLIKNCSSQFNEEVSKDFNNKKIINCILTLDNNDPIFYDINDNLKEHNLWLQKLIKNATKKYYLQFNNLFYRYFNYHLINKPPEIRNGFTNIYNKLHQIGIKSLESNKKICRVVPKYVLKLSKDLKESLNNNNKEELKKIITEKELFEQRICQYVEIFIKDIFDHDEKDDIEI